MDERFQHKTFLTLLDRFEQWLETEGGSYFDAEELSTLAEYYQQEGQMDKAWKAIDLALAIFPGATLPLAFKARYAIAYEDNIAKAARLVSQIADKSDLEYIYINGEVLIAQGHADLADETFLQHYEEGDDNYNLDIAEIYADYEVYDFAAQWINRVEDQQSNDYKELKARILVGQGKLKEGEQLFNELLDGNPYSAPYWNQLAATQMMANNIQDSITSSEFSIAINPNDSEAILNKANGLYNLGNYDEAAKYYEQYGRLCPDVETGPLFQGICLINQSRATMALPYLEEAARRAKSPRILVDVYQEMAFASSYIGQYTNALDYVDKAQALALDNQMDASVISDLTVLRGHIYLQEESLESALQEFKKAVYDSHSDPAIILKIAVSAYDCGYMEVAFNLLYDLLIDIDDNWTEGYGYLARCAHEIKREDIYQWALKRAAEKNPTEARYMLSDLYPEGTDPRDYPKTGKKMKAES